MTDPKSIYRDATISQDTRDALADLGKSVRHPDLRTAIAEVVERWDANEATEIVAAE